MSTKRRWQGGENQWDGGEKKRSRSRRKHLYLLLDDWSRGFTIHRIDADSLHSDSGDRQGASLLPGSPAVRIETSPGGATSHVGTSIAALGSKIIVFTDQRCALVYDTRTDGLSVGPHAPAGMRCDSGITVPVGRTLYALSHRFHDMQHFLELEAMSWDSPNPTGPAAATEGGWSWKSLPAPLPPFRHNQFVTSHAVHPDGRTIFMTTANRETPGRLHAGTFSFDTESCEWRWHGEWALPFVGRGYFDAGLDRWVGLRRDGHVCACRVASRSRSLTGIMELDWQAAEEKLFRRDPEEEHMSASLVYMGGSRFCLVEGVMRQGVDTGCSLADQDDGCWLHVTMFGLGHNHRGELQTTHHQSRRSYVVSRYQYNVFAPQAFWM